MDKVVEFRGTDGLVIAEVTEDTSTNYTTGDVEELAPVAEIGKEIAQGKATKHYDNKPMIVIRSKGEDTITCQVPVLSLKTLAMVTGQYYDEETGALLEGTPTEKYFALGYRLKLTDGTYRYVWRLKGAFSIPTETSKTEDDGTESQGQQLQYTGITPIHKFAKGGNKSAVVVDERDGKVDVSDFFGQVVTPDSLAPLTA